MDQPLFSPETYLAPQSVQVSGPIIEAPPSVAPLNDEVTAEDAEGSLAIADVWSIDACSGDEEAPKVDDENYTPHVSSKLVGLYRFPNGTKIATICKDKKLYCVAHEIAISLRIQLVNLTQVKCSNTESTRIRAMGRGKFKENFEFRIVPLSEILELMEKQSSNGSEKISPVQTFHPVNIVKTTLPNILRRSSSNKSKQLKFENSGLTSSEANRSVSQEPPRTEMRATPSVSTSNNPSLTTSMPISLPTATIETSPLDTKKIQGPLDALVTQVSLFHATKLSVVSSLRSRIDTTEVLQQCAENSQTTTLVNPVATMSSITPLVTVCKIEATLPTSLEAFNVSDALVSQSNNATSQNFKTTTVVSSCHTSSANIAGSKESEIAICDAVETVTVQVQQTDPLANSNGSPDVVFVSEKSSSKDVQGNAILYLALKQLSRRC